MDTLPLKDSIPPHNDDAERATLGAVLIDSDALSVVLQYLRPEDFYKTAHKKLFQVVLDLSGRAEAIDLLTVSDELKKRGELELCGGMSYLATLTSSVPSVANA